MEELPIASDTPIALIGGAPPDAHGLDILRRCGLPLIAADGGADVALAAGLVPICVIGDFDSIAERSRLEALNVPLHQIDRQDDTDFDKSLKAISAPGILASGFTGGRIDHTLAGISSIARHPAGRLVVIGGPDIVLRAPRSIALDLPADTRFSIWPVTRVRARSNGLQWALDGLTLCPTGLIGTSNRTIGPVTLDIDEGTALLILPRDCLEPVREALGW